MTPTATAPTAERTKADCKGSDTCKTHTEVEMARLHTELPDAERRRRYEIVARRSDILTKLSHLSYDLGNLSREIDNLSTGRSPFGHAVEADPGFADEARAEIVFAIGNGATLKLQRAYEVLSALAQDHPTTDWTGVVPEAGEFPR